LGPEERKKVIEEVRKLNPECSLPTLVVGDKVVVGFREIKSRRPPEIK